MVNFRNIIDNRLYKILLRLTDHKEDEIDNEKITDWLIQSYKNEGFKDYLTNRYLVLNRYLMGGFKGGEAYRGVLLKKMELMELEQKAREAYQTKQNN